MTVKRASMCEVCNDPLGPHANRIQVGRKLSGTPREIHDRARCRKKWHANEELIRARWPESRLASPRLEESAKELVGNVAPPLELVVMKPGPTERPSTQVIEPPASPAPQEEPMAATAAVAAPKKKRHHWKLKPELVNAVLEYFHRNPYRSGSAGRLWAVLDATKPFLLVDEDGVAINEATLSAQVTKILRDAKGALVQRMAYDATTAAVAPPPAYKDLRPAMEKAQVLVAGILALAAAGDVDTLAALESLMQEQG